MQPIKATKLWSQAYEALLAEIRDMAQGENRLPPEEELAKTLSISRATVREAMQSLVQEGYITRRHGKGNFAHPSVSALPHRIDLTADFMKLLRTNGQDPVCRNLYSKTASPSAAMSARFPDPVDTVFTQCWRYSVDGKPMILCNVETPSVLLRHDPEAPDEHYRLLDWLADYCGQDMAYYATHLGCRAEPEAAQALSLPEDTWMQNWQQVVYGISDEAVSFCDIYFHPQNVDLSMVLRF